MISKNSGGITLIALVITIIVLLILAGVSLYLTWGNNGIIAKSQKASIAQRLAGYREDLEFGLFGVLKYSKETRKNVYVIGEDVKEYIKKLDSKDVGKIAIFEGELAFITDEDTLESDVAKEIGIKVFYGENDFLICQKFSKYQIQIDNRIQSLSESDKEYVYAIGEDVSNYISEIEPEDEGKIAVYRGKVAYISQEINDMIELIKSKNIVVAANEDDLKYMIELSILEKYTKYFDNTNEKVGVKLGTDKVSIAGIEYGLGWYEIGQEGSNLQNELNQLGLSNKDKTFMTHSPYIVTYNIGYVQSVVGKRMYAGTSNEIWKYTFNYSGNGNDIVIDNILTAVTSESTKSATQFGDFKPTKTPAASGGTQDVINSNYIDNYTYDEDGGVVLTDKTNILSVPIDQSKSICDKFSVCITFKCDLYSNLQGEPKYTGTDYGGCLLGISDNTGLDVCSIRISKGLVRVITFRYNGGVEKLSTPQTGEGYGIFDLSSYNNKFMNLIITAQRGENTNVYLNGSLISSFPSGSEQYTYKNLTIGDLRSRKGYEILR